MIGKNTIVAVCNSKGGVGKSTLAVHLAWTRLADRGGRVAIIDAEPGEGGASVWADARALQKVTQITVIKAESGTLQKVLVEASKHFDNIVIDTPGHITKDIDAALMLSDVAFIPVTPGSFSTWKISENQELIRIANQKREAGGFNPVRSLYALNNFKKNATKQIREAKEFLGQEYGITCADTVVTSNAVYDKAIGVGLTIFEYQEGTKYENIPHTQIRELRELAEEVFTW